jgi:hypothetical protein
MQKPTIEDLEEIVMCIPKDVEVLLLQIDARSAMNKRLLYSQVMPTSAAKIENKE